MLFLPTLCNRQPKVFYYTQNARLKFPSSITPVNCIITMYDNKTMQILTQRQTQTLSEINSVQRHELRRLVRLELDLNYRVRILDKVQVKGEGSHQQFTGNLIIVDNRTREKYQIWIQNLRSSKDKLRRYFSSATWLRETVLNRYQLIRQFTQVSLPMNGSTLTSYVLLKDPLTFRNYMAKVYKKSQFISLKQNHKDYSSIIRQINLMNLSHSKHIMRYSQFYQDSQQLYLFYSQKPTMILSQYMRQNGQIPSSKIKLIMRQLIKAIQEMGRLEIMHNGLKASSVFVIEDNQEWKVCLGEFQLAGKGMGEKEEREEREGVVKQKQKEIDKFQYLAPQLLPGNEFHGDIVENNSDMFSLGVLFYQLLFKKQLFTETSLQQRVSNHPIDISSNHFQSLSPNCFNLFKQLIEFDPNFRINPHQALQHKYFMKRQSYKFGETFLNSFNSSHSAHTLQILIQDTYSKKLNLENKRVRNRYYETVPIKGFHPLNAVMQKNSIKPSKRSTYLDVVQRSDQEDDVMDAIVDDKQMDDSHGRLNPRDVRTMRPAWNVNRMR